MSALADKAILRLVMEKMQLESTLEAVKRENVKLQGYAKHRNGPDMFCNWLKHSDNLCTCGLDELLKPLEVDDE
jgi:hypothetical protein